MRTIKFRGKIMNSNNWIYGSYHEHIDITPAAIYKTIEERDKHITEHTHHYIIQDGFSDYNMPRNIQCFDVTSETIGQFTGLYDCHGKEIYEGDILDINGSIFEVRFSCGVFGFIPHGSIDDEMSNCLRKGFASVIGNIYDNPELLEGGEK